MADLNVRAATAADVPLMLCFIKELASYEREPAAVRACEGDLLRDGFGPVPRFHCFLAEWRGQGAGFALYFYNYSTWEGRCGIYLEDLFVREEYRGQGIGKALLRAVTRVAASEGCTRLNWNVLKWNQPAIDFYLSLGATILEDWSICRLASPALEQIAEPGHAAQ